MKLSVGAIGKMLDWMRESGYFASRNLAKTDTKAESNVKQIASALEMLRMSNIKLDTVSDPAPTRESCVLFASLMLFSS